MILPSMSSSLKLNYSMMGMISAGNFSGYLGSVISCSLILNFITPRLLICLGLFLISSCMILVSFAESYISVVILYTITGIGSGAVNVPVMSLVNRWFVPEYRGKAAGFMAIGSGFAIMLSGWMIPFINNIYADLGWRISWKLSSLIVFLSAIAAGLFIRNTPEDIGIKPYGEKTNTNIPPVKHETTASIYKNLKSYHLGIIYALFGFTYSAYVTFIITYSVKELHYTQYSAGKFWFFTGLFSLISGPVFGAISDKFSRKAGFIIVFGIQSFSYACAAYGYYPLFFKISIVLFGITAWSIPAIMTAAVSDNYPSQQMAAAFGFITFIFGIGQICSPASAGWIADKTGSFKYSFFLISGMAITAVILASFISKKSDFKKNS
ncbi:MFS transporter [Candidatus Dependentiae bacterium]|nr:MFS transporter [Candidatus Dependentiae bacterium]